MTLADLTIICGENNTGKTYVTIETMNEIQTEILFGVSFESGAATAQRFTLMRDIFRKKAHAHQDQGKRSFGVTQNAQRQGP